MDFGVFEMRNCKNYLRGVCMSVIKEINLTVRYEVITDLLLKSQAVRNVKSSVERILQTFRKMVLPSSLGSSKLSEKKL
jgi:hypothetical protein